MSGSLALNLQAVLLRHSWLALQSHLQVLSGDGIIFPPNHFAGSTDFQPPSVRDTSTSLCAVSLSWHQPEPDAPQERSGEHGRRTKVFFDNSRVCCEDEQGTCGPSDHWRRQAIQGLSEQAPRPVTPDSADIRTTQSWPAVPVKEGLTCAPLGTDFWKLKLSFLQVWAVPFSYSCKAIILSKMISFQKDVHSKNSTAFRRDELLFHGVEFSFPPHYPGDKTHSCENSVLAHWTGSWATGGIMLIWLLEMQKQVQCSRNQNAAQQLTFTCLILPLYKVT